MAKCNKSVRTVGRHKRKFVCVPLLFPEKFAANTGFGIRSSDAKQNAHDAHFVNRPDGH